MRQINIQTQLTGIFHSINKTLFTDGRTDAYWVAGNLKSHKAKLTAHYRRQSEKNAEVVPAFFIPFICSIFISLRTKFGTAGYRRYIQWEQIPVNIVSGPFFSLKMSPAGRWPPQDDYRDNWHLKLMKERRSI